MKEQWNPKEGSRCLYCIYYHEKMVGVCDAFPKGIPHEILSSEFNHINPHPKDNGIQFALNPEAVKKWGW